MGKIIINVDYTDNFAACPANEEIACVSTGRTFEELKQNMEEGLRWHIDTMRKDGDPIPEEFEGEWQLEWNMSDRALQNYTEGQQQLTHDDAAVYRYLCQTEPEGFEMASKEEKEAFEKSLGL